MKKKSFSICILAIVCLFLIANNAIGSNIRQKLACFPFIPLTLRAISETENLLSALLNDIDKAGYFELIERKKIENIMDLESVRTDDRSRDTLITIGNKYGIDFLLSGSVNTTDSGLVMELQLFDVKGKKACVTDTYNLSERDASAKKLQDIANDIVKGAKTCSGAGGGAASQPLVPPSNLTVAGTSDAIRIRWSYPAPDQLLGYKVFKSAKEEGPFNQVATTTEPYFSDRNLKLNEVFYYKIKAISQTGAESDFSDVVTGKTSVAPHTPIFLSLSPDIKGASLKWVPRPQSEKDNDLVVAGFKIYRKTPKDKNFIDIAKVNNETKEFNDTGLKDGDEYIYAITAYNENKIESHISAQLRVKTIPTMNPLNVSNGKIRFVPISWGSLSSEVIEGYRIYRSDSKDGSYKRITQISNRSTSSYTDRDLDDNKTYWYRITAYNRNNVETDMSEPVSAKTRDKPPVPKGLRARGTEPKKVVLEWSLINNQEEEIKGYKIYRSVSEDGNYKLINDVRSDRDTYTDDDFDIKEDKVFYYKISSFNSANAESSLSAPVSAKAKAEPKK